MNAFGFNVMTEAEMKAFAIKNIEKDIEGEYIINAITLNEEYSNRNTQEYLGEVYYKEDGEEVSSVFVIIVYKNGTYEFEWH